MIPHIFHWNWLGNEPLAERYKDCMLTWLVRHLGWQVNFWTLDNIPPLKNQKEFDEAPCMATKSSILRVELVHIFGGVYVDVDFECIKNIEPLLDTPILIGHETDASLCDALLGGVPGHPYLAKAIEDFPEWYIEHRDKRTVTNEPYPPDFGPKFLTHIYGLHPWDFKPLTNRKLVYPYFIGETPRVYPESYAVHHWAGTWH